MKRAHLITLIGALCLPMGFLRQACAIRSTPCSCRRSNSPDAKADPSRRGFPSPLGKNECHEQVLMRSLRSKIEPVRKSSCQEQVLMWSLRSTFEPVQKQSCHGQVLMWSLRSKIEPVQKQSPLGVWAQSCHDLPDHEHGLTTAGHLSARSSAGCKIGAPLVLLAARVIASE